MWHPQTVLTWTLTLKIRELLPALQSIVCIEVTATSMWRETWQSGTDWVSGRALTGSRGLTELQVMMQVFCLDLSYKHDSVYCCTCSAEANPSAGSSPAAASAARLRPARGGLNN